jgi:hypothetical protein
MPSPGELVEPPASITNVSGTAAWSSPISSSSARMVGVSTMTRAAPLSATIQCSCSAAEVS